MHSGFVRHGSLALVLIAMFAPSHAGAHGGLLGRVKKRVEENVGRQADRAVHCAMGDQSCIDKAKADGKPVKIDSTRTVPAPSAPAGGGAESGRVMMDGTYAKVYVDAVRVANVPNFNIERGTRIGFYCDGGMSIGGIRVAEGGRKL